MKTVTLILVVLVITYACLFGGAGITRLTTLRFRRGSVAIFAAAVQIAHVVLPQHRFVLTCLTTILLGWFCWENRGHSGMLCITLGLMLNLLVMLANQGTMPVSPGSVEHVRSLMDPTATMILQGKGAVIPDGQAAFAMLGDRLLLPGPLAHLAIWSIGDWILLTGVAWLLAQTMKGRIHVESWTDNNLTA